MPEKKDLTCIGCPMGCALQVEFAKDGELHVTGYQCLKGLEYAKKEVTNPTRIVTSTLPVLFGKQKTVSVKTDKDLPKDKIFACMDLLKGLKVEAPVAIGDVILANILGTDVSIVATKGVEHS